MVVRNELPQNEEPLNQNVLLFSMDFCFSDVTGAPESRVI
jgi:hypothetical protein